MYTNIQMNVRLYVGLIYLEKTEPIVTIFFTHIPSDSRSILCLVFFRKVTIKVYTLTHKFRFGSRKSNNFFLT